MSTLSRLASSDSSGATALVGASSGDSHMPGCFWLRYAVCCSRPPCVDERCPWAPRPFAATARLAGARPLACDGTQPCVCGHALLRICLFPAAAQQQLQLGFGCNCVVVCQMALAFGTCSALTPNAWQRQLAKTSSGHAAVAPTGEAAWKDDLPSHLLKHEIRSASPLNLSI